MTDTVNVPREPTEAMISAGSSEGSRCGVWIGDGRLIEVYRAMLASAPKAEPDWNYEGAMADLQSAITVLIRRINGEADLASAAEWVRLNYPSRAPEIVARTEAPKVEQGPVAWLRDAHEGQDDECLVPAAQGDPDAFPVYHPAPASDELLEAVVRVAGWLEYAFNDEWTPDSLHLASIDLGNFRAAIAKRKGPQS